MSAPQPTGAGALALRLYVAGNAPNSVRARANLSRLCAGLAQPFSLEVVDVHETPRRALADGVRLTPTLLKLGPPPPLRLVGDLSDTPRVRALLGIGDSPEAG